MEGANSFFRRLGVTWSMRAELPTITTCRKGGHDEVSDSTKQKQPQLASHVLEEYVFCSGKKIPLGPKYFQ